jgi:periplasmic copper chaperone A
MTKIAFTRVCAAFGLLALAMPAYAHDYKAGSLTIDHPWTRATPGGAKVGGGFMKITNTGTEPDRLIGGSAEIANVFEVHEMKMEGNVMKMRALEKGLEIKPGETVELRPGGYHVMFIDIKSPFKEGEKIKGQLVFEKAGKVDVEFKIEGRGASGGTGHDAHAGHGTKAP